LKVFRKSKGVQKEHVLALDIGTEYVKALIVEVAGNTGKIQGIGRVRQTLGDMQSGYVTDISGVIENAKEAIKQAEKMAGVVPHQLIMGIAGELVKGDTSVIEYTRNEPDVKINMEELRNIIHKVQWKAFEEVRGRLAYETGHNEIDVKLVNAAIIDVSIDGYKATNPVGFQGKQVTMSIFNVFAPLVHYGALQTIAAELDMDLLAITAEPYAVGRSIADESAGRVNAIIIDIGGGTTDVAVVQDGAVEGTKMFTLGGRSFTKRLSQSLNVSFDEAEKIKVAYSDGKLEKQSQKIVRESMESDTDVWLTGIVLTLSEFEGVGTLPSKIYICGGGSKLPEIKAALSGDHWYKKLPFAKKPQVNFLTPNEITGLTDGTKKLGGPEDITPMSLAKMSIDFVGEEKILTKILSKVVRLMQA